MSLTHDTQTDDNKFFILASKTANGDWNYQSEYFNSFNNHGGEQDYIKRSATNGTNCRNIISVYIGTLLIFYSLYFIFPFQSYRVVNDNFVRHSHSTHTRIRIQNIYMYTMTRRWDCGFFFFSWAKNHCERMECENNKRRMKRNRNLVRTSDSFSHFYEFNIESSSMNRKERLNSPSDIYRCWCAAIRTQCIRYAHKVRFGGNIELLVILFMWNLWMNCLQIHKMIHDNCNRLGPVGFQMIQ